MARILHIGDLHLDAPFASRTTVREATLRRSEQIETFSKIMGIAAKEADLVLISGDFFDGENLRRETLNSVRRNFEALGDIPVFIAPGNHDPYPVYQKTDFGKNVRVFPPEGAFWDLEGLGLRICGAGFASRFEKPRVMPEDIPKSGEYGNILVIHGDMSGAPGSERYNPLTEGDLKGYDYCALGHIHRCGGINKTPAGAFWAYPGIPEPTGFDEGAGGGYISGEVSRGRVLLKPTSAAKRGYHILNMDFPEGISDNEAVIEKTAAKISEIGTGNIVRVNLTGRCEKGFKPDAGLIEERLRGLCFGIEVTDGTKETLDLTADENDRSFRAEYIRRMKKTAEGFREDSRERHLAERALILGLEAMEGGRDI